MVNEGASDPANAIASALALIHRHSPAGCAIALHHRLQAPLYRVMTVPEAWARTYAARNLALQDPTLRWALAHTGRIGWRGLADRDPGGVLALAAEHGMAHGLAVAVVRGGSRSMAVLTRADRPLAPEEEEEAEGALAALHDATHPDADLDPGQRDALRRLSMAFSIV